MRNNWCVPGVFVFFLLFMAIGHAELTCNVTESASCTGTVVGGLSDTTNAHGDNSGAYPQVICCTENYGGTLGTSCSNGIGKNVTLYHLSDTTNAHGELHNESDYSTNVCLSTSANITLDYGTSCDAFDTCLASLSGNKNAHLGDCNAYSTLVCASTFNLTVNITGLENGFVGTNVFDPLNITVNMYDESTSAGAVGVQGAIWVEKSPGVWDAGNVCTTDANGNCSINFLPDCSYNSGIASVIGGPFGDSHYNDKNSTLKNITIDLGGRCSDVVTFSIEANLDGNSGDSGEADGQGAGFYGPNDIVRYYTCVDDSSITGNPVLALISAGEELNYINLTAGNSFVQKISQSQTGNKFILGVSKGGCSVVNQKSLDIMAGSLTALSSFFTGSTGRIQISVQYPNVDIVGDLTKTGRFTIGLEKNQTNVTQIIVRDI